MSVRTTTVTAPGRKSRWGVFTAPAAIGRPQVAGSARYDARSDQYRITGGGAESAPARQASHCLWRWIEGDFIATAEAAFVGEGGSTDPSRRLGWTVRDSLEADSPAADACVRGDGVVALRFRRDASGECEAIQAPQVESFGVIQLERRGATFIFSSAKFGEAFSSIELPGRALESRVYLALFVGSHVADAPATAMFRNVRIVRPAPAGLVQYQDYLGSHLEILQVDTGSRQIVHSVPDSLQAPNWTPDGRCLIYNRNGRLYRFELESRTVVEIDTEFATDNNNDHVLSPDGTVLGISHHAVEDDGHSHIYTVPVGGGVPRKVTRHGPSYLHGWSPDGKFLIYTAGRAGRWNIYRIPVGGGEEVPLTDTETLNDGSEYSPDGKFIYFNSTRGGLMQIWRMRADGTEPEQVTDDCLNNWFPHLSPDGREMVFLSYLPDVEPSKHPFYQQVYLRRAPVEGGKPRVIAYLYGGQGTINVPSWSPDGSRVAFVSNSGME